MSSCTSTNSIPEKMNEVQLATGTRGWIMKLRGEQKGDPGTESSARSTSRSTIVLKNVFFVRTYCYGCQVIRGLSAHSEKERPAPEEVSLSTFQHPPPHQVTPADQWGLFPSCRPPRLYQAIGRKGTFQETKADRYIVFKILKTNKDYIKKIKWRIWLKGEPSIICYCFVF